MGEKTCYYQNKKQGIELVYLKDSILCYPEHNHSSIYTFIIVLKGEIAVNLDKEKKIYTEGSIISIMPYEPHAIMPTDKEYTILTLCMKKQLISESMERLEEMIKDNLRDVKEEIELPKAFEEELIVCVKKEKTKEVSVNADSEMIRVREYIEKHPEEELSLEELSKNLYMSKYHLIRLFKENAGLTPHKFQLQNRVRKAQRLLEKNISLAEVTYITGFYDQSHFIKEFKKILGVTPSKYRELLY